MPTISFKSEKERKTHPQGKRLNPYLANKYFKNRLTELEMGALEGDRPSLPKKHIKSSSTQEKERLFICLLSNPTPLINQQLLLVNEKLFEFTNKELARLCTMIGRIDILDDIRSIQPSLDIKSALTRVCPQSKSKFSPLFIILSKSLYTLRTPLI